MLKWYKVKDKLPKDGKEVLIRAKVANDTSYSIAILFIENDEIDWVIDNQGLDEEDITHWAYFNKP